MRIISGFYKGTRIKAVDGDTARPTSDFIKEMIFSTLYSINTSFEKVLDLYAGSGSLGLEALSRGAREITFIDASKKSISAIIANINLLKCHEKCRVFQRKVETFLMTSSIPKSSDFTSKYDLVFADPPYNKGLINNTIKLILEKKHLTEDGILVAEHSIYEPIADMFKNFVFKEKKTASSIISFINMRRDNADL